MGIARASSKSEGFVSPLGILQKFPKLEQVQTRAAGLSKGKEESLVFKQTVPVL